MIDRKFKITTGDSRFSTNWRVREVTWDQIKAKLSTDNPTKETMAQFRSYDKEKRDNIKDCGGFVGGALRGRKRRKGSVICRSMITLDLDKADLNFWDNFSAFNEYAALVYSTHSHTADKPRLRLVIPLDRDCSPEEYIAVARKVAEDVGIEQMDKTTYQVERLMYYPSHAVDAPFEFHAQDGDLLSVDDTLARYADWRDVSQYPTASDEDMAIGYEVKTVVDPYDKRGVIGAFNRTYSISEAIAKFLPEVYISSGNGRYTYAQGSSTNGAVTYNDDKILYSNHATDPAAGHAQNAYDLVRIHKFGELDKHWDGNPQHRKPSDKAMEELIAEDADVSATLTRETAEACESDFADIEAISVPDDGTPVAAQNEPQTRSLQDVKLERDKNGKPKPIIGNFLQVLEHDPKLKNLGRLNRFTKLMEVNGNLPWDDSAYRRQPGSLWNDSDQAGFRYYCEKKYTLQGKDAARDAVANYFNQHSYHPVKEYLDSLKWDGHKRLERIFVDYLGAEDSMYVRTVTRKMMVAGVARIMRPGCKWDYMLTLTGKQGIGKSTMFRKLGHGWYDDSLTDVRTKDANDQVQGVWIVEMAELTATRKADVEAVKQFISRQVDKYRRAYGQFTDSYPRECIFVGTTNDEAFLRDRTGNRRFWAVEVGVNDPLKSVWDDLTEEVVDQLWAEAKHYYAKGEDLFLGAEVARMAEDMQKLHSDDDATRTEIENFLDTLLPDLWDTDFNLEDRRAFYAGYDIKTPKGSESCHVQRTKVCCLEIACELFGVNRQSITTTNTKQTLREIRQIMDTMPGWAHYKSRRRFGSLYGSGRYDGYYRVGSVSDESLLDDSEPSEDKPDWL